MKKCNEDIKVQKNNVSYFLAGFEAGMATGGVDKNEVIRRFYMTTLYPNIARKLLEAYDSKDNDTDGLDYMFRNL